MKMTIWRRGKIAAFERICWVYFCLNILFALTPAHLSKHAWRISQGGLFIFTYQSHHVTVISYPVPHYVFRAGATSFG